MNIEHAIKLHDTLKAALKNRKASKNFDYSSNCGCVAHVCRALGDNRTPLIGEDFVFGYQSAIAQYLDVPNDEHLERLYGFDLPAGLVADGVRRKDSGPAARKLRGVRGLREAIIRLKALVAHHGEGFQLV